MECSNINCSITGNIRMVSCWLCMNHYHFTCSGLKARDADALADPQKFLQWTCPDCRKINIEFYKLFKNSKDEFQNINKDFLELQKRLIQYGELFSNYPNLEKFVNKQQGTSPKCKRDGLRSSSTQNVSPSPLPVDNLNNTSSIILTPTCDLQPPFSQKNCTSSYTNVLKSTPPRPSQTPSVSNNSNKSQPTTGNMGAVSSMTNNSLEISPKPLRVIPPAKNIFISRLASETSIRDIEYYIKSKLGVNCNLTIYKYSYSQPRTTTSFKITVPDEFFEKILDISFWPMSTFVREYVVYKRRNNAVRLPISQISKN